MAFSLPGIKRDDNTIMSPGLTRRYLCLSRAIRESADMGSPCDPVDRTVTCSSGKESRSLTSVSMPSGRFRYPLSEGKLHVGSHRAAYCYHLASKFPSEIVDLLHAVHVRGKGGNENSSLSVSEYLFERGLIALSDRVLLFLSTLVLSESSAKTFPVRA